MIIGIISWGIITLITEASTFLENIGVYFDRISKESQDILSSMKFDKIKIPEELRLILENSTGDFIKTASNLITNILTKSLQISTASLIITG